MDGVARIELIITLDDVLVLAIISGCVSVEITKADGVRYRRRAGRTREREEVRKYGIASDVEVFDFERIRQPKLLGRQPCHTDVAKPARSLGTSSDVVLAKGEGVWS